MQKYILRTLLLASFITVSGTLFSYFLIEKEANRIYAVDDKNLQHISKKIDVAIVFGGGIEDNTPTPIIKDRLHQSKVLLDKGFIRKIIVSGDNRFLNYNEPTVMKNYLVEMLDVDPNLIQEDFAGRSTYETCERAKKIFNIDRVLLVSESTHLPRAIYLCRSFNIDTYGVKSDDNNSTLLTEQRWREILARNKALFNVVIHGEATILGDPIHLNL